MTFRPIRTRFSALVCAVALFVVACGSSPAPEGNYFNVVTMIDRVVNGSFVQTFESPMNITAGWLNDLPGATGWRQIVGPVWSNWAGRYTTPGDVRVPGIWRIQANTSECRGQYITDMININRGDTVYAWCKLVQQITVPSQTFNGDGDTIDQVCCFTDTLYADGTLQAGDYITSQDGRFSLALHGSGELVITNNNAMSFMWGTNTAGTSLGHAIMQADGNLVIYDSGGGAAWHSGTVGYPGAYLIMQNDGNLVIYDVNGWPIWASNTCCH